MPAKTKEMHGLYSIAFTADFKRMFAHWEVVGVVRPRAFSQSSQSYGKYFEIMLYSNKQADLVANVKTDRTEWNGGKQVTEVTLKWIYGTKYFRMDQVKVFKGSLPEILLGPFLNTLSIISFDPVTTPQRQKFPAILSAVTQVCN